TARSNTASAWMNCWDAQRDANGNLHAAANTQHDSAKTTLSINIARATGRRRSRLGFGALSGAAATREAGTGNLERSCTAALQVAAFRRAHTAVLHHSRRL